VILELLRNFSEESIFSIYKIYFVLKREAVGPSVTFANTFSAVQHTNGEV